jgi:ABC-type branched-subunit amino acid transport system substrate-binding protein
VLGLSRGRSRARVLTVGAGVLLAAGFAGCAAAGSSSVKASGKTLTIYASAPPGSGSDQVVQDVLDAERLAFSQKHGEVTAFTLSFPPALDSGKLSDHARTAIQNKGAIAYIGEVIPGDSADSLGINNAQDLLQVAPTDTALELTTSTPAIPNTPARYYESLKTYGRTFARVVPNSQREAKAQVQEMQSMSVKKLYVADDGTEYGKAIAYAVKQSAAPAITVVPTQAGADAIFYGASTNGAAISLFNGAAQANPAVKMFGPSALDNNEFAAGITAGTHNVFISSPGYLNANLSAAGQTFVTAFKTAYRHNPATQAIFGYEAMAALIDVLKQAGSSANDRGIVVRDFFSIKNRSSVLGAPYSIDANGDTSIAPFVFSRLRAGKLVPFVQLQG